MNKEKSITNEKLRITNSQEKRNSKGVIRNSLVPELRFREFEEDWENAPLGEVYSFKITNSFSRDKLNYDEGKVKNVHYGDIHTKFSTLFDIIKEDVPFINQEVSIERISEENYCIEGDIVIADASEDLDDIGKSIEIVNLNNEKLLAGLHTFLARQIEPKLIIGFGGYLFKSDGIRKQIKREAQGAKVLGISKGRISDIKIYYPKEEEEQQKIAATLSTLDQLITSESEKRDALQAHKKGLLQQLFPAPGETVPKVRFGEFEGDWEERKLGEVCNMQAGKFVRASEIKENITDSLFPCYGGNGLRGYTESFTHSGKYSLIGRQGALCGNVNLVDGQFHATEHAVVVTPENSTDTDWLYYVLVLLNLNQYATGQAQPGLSVTNLEQVQLKLPENPQEQQKIAATLTSLDELITAQSEKIAALEAHKKGLMQGLFP